jgi:hypothetical protein
MKILVSFCVASLIAVSTYADGGSTGYSTFRAMGYGGSTGYSTFRAMGYGSTGDSMKLGYGSTGYSTFRAMGYGSTGDSGSFQNRQFTPIRSFIERVRNRRAQRVMTRQMIRSQYVLQEPVQYVLIPESELGFVKPQILETNDYEAPNFVLLESKSALNDRFVFMLVSRN